ILKEKGINIAIDTSGFVWNSKVQEVLEYTDIVLLDIKNFDPHTYKVITGVSLAPTLKFLDYLRDKNISTWVRYVLVPGLSDNLEQVEELSAFLDNYPNVSKIELLGFHKMGEYKWKELGLEYKLTNTKEPSAELMQTVNEILGRNGKNVSVNS
ncbi:MAG: pyruvate formate lyase 1-activating protein, partial [Clostridiales bacterium]|nr:pyruvate formate lyase 1-activating protein [Clostridiales bacterium]